MSIRDSGKLIFSLAAAVAVIVESTADENFSDGFKMSLRFSTVSICWCCCRCFDKPFILGSGGNGTCITFLAVLVGNCD